MKKLSQNSVVAAIFWIAALILTIAVMAPGLSGGFFFDDNPNIVQNPAIQIKALDWASLRGSIAGAEAGPLGRPVSVLSFALTHYVFGLDPFAFKAVNLAIHAINGLLVAWLATLLLQTLPNIQLSERSRTWLALWVAAVWLIHPINIMPVMLAVQRMTLLSGAFMLLALISHLKATATPAENNIRWLWLAASWLIFWPLSALSKETGLLFPLYILAITLLSQPFSGAKRQKKTWIVLASVLSLLFVGMAMLSYLGRGWLDAAYAMRPFSLTERLMTEARVLWFYATQIALPDYGAFATYLDDFEISKGVLNPPSTLFAVFGWGAAALIIIYYRQRQALFSFAAAWFLIGHSLESTFLPLEIAQEYRNYLPSIGLILGVGYLATIILQKLKLDHRTQTTGAAAIIAVLVLSLFTWMRADQLGNPLIGPQIEATRHPQSARANHAAALAMIHAGYGDKGDPIGGKTIRYYFQQSEAVDASFKFGYLGLVVWACASDRPVEQEWINQFTYQLGNSPFAPKDFDLPGHLLKPLLNMPECLSRQKALELFAAGAGNPKISRSLQAKFLESASDYELLVAADIHSAHDYLTRASVTFPEDPKLRQKLKSFELLKAETKPDSNNANRKSLSPKEE